MQFLAERKFTLADQDRFAALSGDFNPMHVDEIAARRTILGAPVVHGVHLLCWVLENWLGNCQIISGAVAFEHLAAIFKRGALIGETVRVFVVNDDAQFSLRVMREQRELTSIRGKLGATVTYSEALPAPGPLRECRAMNAADVAEAAGSLPLAYSEADARAVFPKLTAVLPAFQVAVLFATTRLIGMECPGLHSLFSALDLSFAKDAIGQPRLNYRVVHTRDAELCLAVDGPGFAGELEGSIRPEPRKQVTARELAPLVERGEFSDQSALVIGGSRGLGEVVAKLLALGGAEVTITYHRGRQDAEAVAQEIKVAGRQCRIARFDSHHPAPIPMPRPPTHLYYFATPHIAVDKTAVFSEERFGEYCRYYVSDFVNTLLEAAKGATALGVFYPSTIFLDERPEHMAEYCAAKAAAEEICQHLIRRFPDWRVYAPRLPRMLTDQNNGLIQAEIATPETIMLDHLRRMREESHPKEPLMALDSALH